MNGAKVSFGGGVVHAGADGLYLNTLVAVPRDGLLDLNTMHDDEVEDEGGARSARPLDSAAAEDVHFLEEIPRSQVSGGRIRSIAVRSIAICSIAKFLSPNPRFHH